MNNQIFDKKNNYIYCKLLAKLKWQIRRGMLENEILLKRFLKKYEKKLNNNDIKSLITLLDLSDNDLIDLLMSRIELPENLLYRQDIINILSMLRSI